MRTKNEMVAIEVSKDGKKWERKGIYLNKDKLFMSFGWEVACKDFPHQKIVKA
jgi:hypothetical protein